jgi:hypothetical protein
MVPPLDSRHHVATEGTENTEKITFLKGKIQALK